MPSLDFHTWAALTAALIGLFYYLKARFAQGKIAELQADLTKVLNDAENKTLDDYVKLLQERSAKAREAYEAEKKNTTLRGFVGPTDGNA